MSEGTISQVDNAPPRGVVTCKKKNKSVRNFFGLKNLDYFLPYSRIFLLKFQEFFGFPSFLILQQEVNSVVTSVYWR